MKRTFTASVWREGEWYVAHCLMNSMPCDAHHAQLVAR